MASESRVSPAAPSQYTLPNGPPAPPHRDSAALITELLRRGAALPRLRDENAFLDLQNNCHD